jgi:hypothetical protein
MGIPQLFLPGYQAWGSVAQVAVGDLSDYVVLSAKSHMAGSLVKSQGHITFIATKEFLCGGPHKNSHSH